MLTINNLQVSVDNKPILKGIDLAADDQVVGLIRVDDEADLLTVTENGFGKRTPLLEYLVQSEDGSTRAQNRGGKGIINLKVSDKTGEVVDVKQVRPGDGMVLITLGGLVNVDFADVRAVMSLRGLSLMGTGVDDGEERAVEAFDSNRFIILVDDRQAESLDEYIAEDSAVRVIDVFIDDLDIVGEAIMRIAGFVARLAPIGVFALIAAACGGGEAEETTTTTEATTTTTEAPVTTLPAEPGDTTTTQPEATQFVDVYFLKDGQYATAVATRIPATRDVAANAQKKRMAKRLDMVAANEVGDGRGFDVDENALTLFWEGGQRELPLASKHRLARELVALIAERYREKQQRLEAI